MHPPVLAVRPDERPTIVCPDWCTDTYEFHLEELGEWEGFVIHHSAPRRWVFHTRHAYPDNSMSSEAPRIFCEAPNDLSIAEAEQLVRSLSAAIEEARA